MRWIFLTLLVLNASLLVWGLVAGGPAETAEQRETPYKYRDVRQLTLVSELVAAGGGERPDSSPEPLPDRPEVSEIPLSADGRPLCELVGVFAGREQAAQFVERLDAIDIESELKELELPAGERYQIYLPPQASRKAALRKLTELQAKKIDSYIIPRGELENGISLGMFSQEKLADEHLSKMSRLGLSPAKNVIERTYWEIWVMLAPGEDRKLSNLAWARVMEGMNELERRQNFCLDVASQDNFH